MNNDATPFRLRLTRDLVEPMPKLLFSQSRVFKCPHERMRRHGKMYIGRIAMRVEKLMADDIAKRLEELELAREKMQEQLNSTSEALEAITDKIDDLKSRQEARMRSNDRIDNKVVDQVVQGAPREKVDAEEVTAKPTEKRK